MSACAAPTRDARDNTALRQEINAAVPASWREQAAVTEDIDPLAITPEMRAFAHAAVKGSGNREERIIALTRGIIAEDGLGLKYSPNATHTAAEAFESGTGNCIGFSNLLVASARELGLNARYELVSQWPDWDKVGNVLIGSLHMRVISRIAGTRLVFDFYPEPIDTSFSAHPLSDNDARAHHLNNLAMASMRNGNDARAYAFMMKAIESSPDTAFIWSNLGILLTRHDLGAAAEAALREALLIEPDGLSAMSNLQRLYLAEGRDEEARQLDDQLASHRERNPYWHARLGQRAFDQGDFEDAAGHFRDAIKRKKNEPNFYVQLSKTYEQLGMTRLALKASNKARSLD